MLRLCGSLDSFNTFNVDGKTPEAVSFPNVIDHLRKGVTGWVCVHDGLGYRLLSYLKAQGVRCPEEISVCGFDNFEPPYDGIPKLTSIEASFEKMGAMAVLRLLSKIRCEAPDSLHSMLRTTLVEGSSTAPLKA